MGHLLVPVLRIERRVEEHEPSVLPLHHTGICKRAPGGNRTRNLTLEASHFTIKLLVLGFSGGRKNRTS